MFSGTSRKASAVCKVVNSMGLHARPACILVRKAAEFESAIFFQGGENPDPVEGSSLMGILTLCAPKGTEIKITAEGKDAEEAIAALVALFESGFDED